MNFGARSAYLAGRRPSNMSGGSTQWSSTLTSTRLSTSIVSPFGHGYPGQRTKPPLWRLRAQPRADRPIPGRAAHRYAARRDGGDRPVRARDTVGDDAQRLFELFDGTVRLVMGRRPRPVMGAAA